MKIPKITVADIKKHMVDSTAVMTVITPVMALTEKVLSKLPTPVSINSRLLALAVMYAGFGTIFTQGRDYSSKKIFHLGPNSSEKVKKIHDVAYSLVYGVATTVPFYLIAGAEGEKQVSYSTFWNISATAACGWATGLAVDAFGDFFDIKPSERLPPCIQGFSPIEKKCLAGLAVATSITLTGIVYNLTPFFN